MAVQPFVVTGNVGIGTSTVSAGTRLTIVGTASTVTTNGALSITGGAGISGNINVGGSRSLFTNFVGIGTSTSAGINSNVFTVYGTAMNYGNIVIQNSTGGSGIFFPDGSLQTTAATGSAASAAGGTGAVQYANGTAFAGNNTQFYYDSVNYRLGLGTNDTSASTMNVSGSLPALFNTQSSGNPTIIAGTTTSSGSTMGWNAASSFGFLGLATGGNKLSWNSTGVGINGVTPVNALDVSGGAVIGGGAAYAGTASAPSNGLLVQGLVGIGTATVTTGYALQVQGNLLVVGNVVATTVQVTSATAPVNGLFLPATNAVGFATASTERMRINSGGNVLIGTTTTPLNGNATVVIQGVGTNGGGIQLSGGAGGGFKQDGLNGGGWALHSYTGAVGAETYTERMRIDSAGNISTTGTNATTGFNAEFKTGIKVGGVAANHSIFAGDIGIGTSTTTGMTGTEMLTVFGSVNIVSTTGAYLVNGVAAGGGVTITNDVTTNSNNYFPLLSNNTTSGTLSAAVTSNTDLYFNPSTGTLSAIVFNSLSDLNKKTDIRVIDDSSAIIDQIRGVRFNWRDNGLPSAGLIAQDVESAMPELVNAAEDGTKSLNYNGIIGVLVETIKELRSDVRALNIKVADLEARMTNDDI